MSIPDWPSLWEKEPGLRPDWVVVFHGHRYTHGQIYDEEGVLTLPDDVASSLCRDAAVRWLTNQGYVISDRYVFDPDHGELTISIGSGDTLDDALFAACKAIIEGKK